MMRLERNLEVERQAFMSVHDYTIYQIFSVFAKQTTDLIS